MHDPLTMTAAIGLPFVRFEHREFLLAPDARMFPGTGARAWVSAGADYAAFVSWVLNTLRCGKPARPPTCDHAMDALRALASELHAQEGPMNDSLVEQREARQDE
jgi:hypothetical protein